jgi:hypothetical protein
MLVEVVEVLVVADELPEHEDGLGQGQARQHFPVKILLHGPVLGRGRDGSPTPGMAMSYDLARPGKQWYKEIYLQKSWKTATGLEGPVTTGRTS